MNVKFSDLGKYCDDLQYLAAEKMAENVVLKEVESRLWVTKVDTFEVEIMLHNQSTLKQISCDCDIPKEKNKFCTHQLAALILLNSQFEEKRVAQKIADGSRMAVAVPVEKFTIKSVLDQVSQEELLNFIREYSKSNRNFTMSLKSHFASKINIGFDENKYQLLFENITKSFQNPKGKLTRQGIQQFYKLWKQLNQQADNELITGNFLQQWIIVKELFQVAYQSFRLFPTDEIKKIDDGLLLLLDHMQPVFKSSAAPALKNEIWLFLSQETTRRRYWRNGVAFRILNLLIANGNQEQLERLLEKATVELDETVDVARKKLIFSILSILYRQKKVTEYKKIIQKYELEQTDFLHFATLFFESSCWSLAQYVCNIGILEAPKSDVFKQLSDLLLSVYMMEKDFENVTKLSKKLIFIYFEPSYFDVLKQNLHRSSKWQREAENLIIKLNDEAETMSLGLLAHIYSHEKMWEELYLHLQKCDNFELYLKYGEVLLNNNLVSEKFRIDYENFVVNYLKSHFGAPAVEKMTLIIKHLYAIKQDFFASRLLKSIRKEFKERKILLEELVEL